MMKTKIYVIGILSIFFALTACSDDNSVSETDPDPENPDLDAALIGNWIIDPTAGSLGVGPSKDDMSWWSITPEEIEDLACLYDDLYVFNDDGTFENVVGDETWLETWQGVEDSCGEPIAPHNGSTTGEWLATDGLVTITGKGLYLGMAKVHNTDDDGSPVDNTITYNYELSNNDEILEVTIDGWHSVIPEATWYFRFTKEE